MAVVLIIIGIIFLLENYGFISGAWFLWPLLPLIIGVGFCMLFFRARKDIVLLGLGCFILLNSIFFLFLNFTGWSLLTYLWPVFIIILGLTFIACYAVSKKKILIYLAIILIALATSFILIFAVSTSLWPISIILTGASFMIINLFEIRNKKSGVSRAKKK
jgi:hypothetical protein